MFLLEGLPAVLFGFLALRYLTERPTDAQWLDPPQRAWLSRHIESEQQRIGEGSILRALANPMVWLLSLPYFSIFAVGNSYISWAPTLVRSALGTTNTMTAFIVAGMSLLVVPFYPLAARVSDRSNERCAIAALGVTLHCAGCMGVAWSPRSGWHRPDQLNRDHRRLLRPGHRRLLQTAHRQ